MVTDTHDFKFTQYIIINSDIKEMKKGKMIAQGAHASLGAYLNSNDHKLKQMWLDEGGRKIVVKASEAMILEIYNSLFESNIPAYIVYDFGLTQVKPNTLTCLCIGPYMKYKLESFVKDLKLV